MTAALATVNVAAAACTDAADAPEPIDMPRLTRIDSLVLEETPAVTLGDVSHFTISDADVWVVDRQNGRLVRFARDGRLRATFGRTGSGPGELTAPGPLALVGDTTLVVLDYGRGAIVQFRVADGTPLAELPLREQVMATQLQSVGDTIWMGAVGLRNGMGVMHVSSGDGALGRSVPHPREFADEGGLHWSLPFAIALRLEDATLVAYAGHHRTILHRDDGSMDSLLVPSPRRRGVPADLASRAATGAYRETLGGLEGAVSLPVRAHQLPDGSLALVHVDIEVSPDADPSTGRGARYRAFLTVIRSDFAAACVDAPIPAGEGSSLPGLAFHGDTLSVLEQRIVDDRAVPVLSSYRIDLRGCQWMPVGRG